MVGNKNLELDRLVDSPSVCSVCSDSKFFKYVQTQLLFKLLL